MQLGIHDPKYSGAAKCALLAVTITCSCSSLAPLPYAFSYSQWFSARRTEPLCSNLDIASSVKAPGFCENPASTKIKEKMKPFAFLTVLLPIPFSAPSIRGKLVFRVIKLIVTFLTTLWKHVLIQWVLSQLSLGLPWVWGRKVGCLLAGGRVEGRGIGRQVFCHCVFAPRRSLREFPPPLPTSPDHRPFSSCCLPCLHTCPKPCPPRLCCQCPDAGQGIPRRGGASGK